MHPFLFRSSLLHCQCPRSRRWRHHLEGLSLIEVLCCLAILALLATASQTVHRGSLDRLKVHQAMSTLHTALALARSEAIHRGQATTLCAGNATLGCTGDWQQGLLVFSDLNANGQWDENEPLQRVFTISGDQVKLQMAAFPNRQSLTFLSDGGTAGQSGNFTFCPRSLDPYQARQLVFIRSGRVRPSRDRNGDGLHEDSQGRPLHCDW